MNRIMKRACYILALIVLWPSFAEARIKLVALPERARVVVALTHPDATLVEEERVVTLQKGVNHMDFSWRGVNIDPSTIQLRLLSHPDQIGFKSITTSYPPNENALVWVAGRAHAHLIRHPSKQFLRRKPYRRVTRRGKAATEGRRD